MIVDSLGLGGSGVGVTGSVEVVVYGGLGIAEYDGLVPLSADSDSSPEPSLTPPESPPPLEPESDVAKDGCISTEMIAIDVIDDKSDKQLKRQMVVLSHTIEEISIYFFYVI